jgi:flagellin-like hook-associated protein FlgL
MHKDVDAILSELNCNFKSRDIVKTLTAGQKQMIAIAKAIYHHSDIISFDEPTASLTSKETEALFAVIRKLKADGTPETDRDGNILYIDDQWYKSPIAAAMAENGDITFADGESTLATGTKFSIDQMCEAIYRNDQTAREFINDIDKAIDNVSLRVTEIGAYMNRLESAIESTDVQRESLTQSISTLKDADVAKESSDYIKWQILQQSTATLLSTANQQPQIALNLL